MNTILVDTVLGKVENIEEIISHELAVVATWKEQGVLAHIFTKEAMGGAVLVFNETNQEKVEKLLTQLPLYKHFTKIEYKLLNQQF
jgi:muconolactone delta-isomerase